MHTTKTVGIALGGLVSSLNEDVGCPDPRISLGVLFEPGELGVAQRLGDAKYLILLLFLVEEVRYMR
jgi:hypothetical protein